MKLPIKISISLLLFLFMTPCYAQIIDNETLKESRELNKKGYEYGSRGKFEEAKEVFEKVCEKVKISRYSIVRDHPKRYIRIIEDVNNQRLKADTAMQFFKVKADSSLSYQEREAELKKIIESAPMFVEVYRELLEWDKAIEINPDYIDAYRIRGDRYLRRDQYDEAISDYNNVIRLNPEDAEYYSSRGTAYYFKGIYSYFGKKSNYLNAIIDFSKAIELGPNQGDDEDYKYNFRGDAYAQIGRIEEAIADYSKVIELKARDAAAYYKRGLAYAEAGEHEKAIADYNLILEMYPGSKDAYKFRGDAHNKIGDLKQACLDWKKACSYGSGNCEGWSVINRIRCLGK